MNVKVKISRDLYEKILTDLARPHSFAYERVGFLTSRIGNQGGETLLILFISYLSLDDAQYIEDPSVGARINSSAIRMVMQHSLDTGEGIFHVHQHGHRGIPYLSRTDLRETLPLAKSFRNVKPAAAHGIFLLSKNKAKSLIWLPGLAMPVEKTRISVIGHPMTFLEKEYGK